MSNIMKERQDLLFKGSFNAIIRYSSISLIALFGATIGIFMLMFQPIIGVSIIFICIVSSIYILIKFTDDKHAIFFYDDNFEEIKNNQIIIHSYADIDTVQYKVPGRDIDRIIIKLNSSKKLVFKMEFNGVYKTVVISFFKHLREKNPMIEIRYKFWGEDKKIIKREVR